MKTLLTAITGFIFNVVLHTPVMGHGNTNNQSQKIVLTFKNTPDIDYSFRYLNGIVVAWEGPEIEVCEATSTEYINLEKKQIPDSKVFAINNEYIVLRHKINYLEYHQYLLKRGDSVVFEYRNGMPFASVTNRKVLPYDLNFEQHVNLRFAKENFSPLAKYFNTGNFSNVNISRLISGQKPTPVQLHENRKKVIAAGKKEQYATAKSFLIAENNLLDSLKTHGAISEEPYKFYKNKVEKLNSILDMEAGKISISQIQKLLVEQSTATYYFPPIYHQLFVEAIADQFISPKAKFMDLKNGINLDHQQIFAQIDSSTIFTEGDKNYLLTRELFRIAETFSNEDFLAFFNIYEERVKDTMLINKIRKEYALRFNDNINETRSLRLLSLDNKSLTFDEVKKRYAGKVIYVDFWASWCAPCRAAMPQSIKLRNELKKDIVFVYLSIDRTIQPWQTASAKEKLDSYTDNYLLVNYEASSFVKQQNLREIPRYMIFDKQGKLAYARAPQVESKDLMPLLLRIAKE